MQCFHGGADGKGEQADVTKRLHWLLELMGYMKGVVAGTVGMLNPQQSVDQVGTQARI